MKTEENKKQENSETETKEYPKSPAQHQTAEEQDNPTSIGKQDPCFDPY